MVQNHRTVLTHNNTLLIFTRFKSSHLLSKFASRSNVLLFFRQCLSRGHYRPTWLPPKPVYLLNNISMHRCLSSNYFCRKEPTEKKSSSTVSLFHPSYFTSKHNVLVLKSPVSVALKGSSQMLFIQRKVY